MIVISEPLPDSKEGYRSIHDITSDESKIGRIEVNYLQRDEAKSFKRLKRKLKAGHPFNVKVVLNAEDQLITKDKISEVIQAAVNFFNGLEPRDIYVVKENKSGKEYLGKGSSLQ
jgi:hypothetical protein